MPKAKAPLAPFADAFKDLPIDTAMFEDAYKSATSLNEKLAASAIKAAGSAQELTDGWTKDALAKAGELTKAKAEPADYFKAIADAATQQSDLALKNITAFGEIMKACQTETLELLTAAGKELNEGAAAAVKDSTEKATAAAKKLSAAA